MPRLPSRHRALIPAIALLAAAAPAAVTTPSATTTAADAVVQDDGPGAGTLMLRGPRIAQALPAVRLGTDMDVTVTGPVARVRVTQVFRNTSSAWMEATYLYPLPQDGAVDALKMVVGKRVIVGHIEKRAAARATYEAATCLDCARYKRVGELFKITVITLQRQVDPHRRLRFTARGRPHVGIWMPHSLLPSGSRT